MVSLSKEMEMITDRDNVYIGIGIECYNNSRLPADNYIPPSMRLCSRRCFIDAYFNYPNMIFLCGVAFVDGKLQEYKDKYNWGAILSHEYLHYMLFKYIGQKANHMFNNIDIWEYCGVDEEG